MNTREAEDPRAPRILIIRLSAIGDVVMASPLAAALRRRYPQAHIAWLVQPEAAGLLTANPAVDEVIPWPRGVWAGLWRQRRWWALARAVRGFVRELRERRFDWALDAQGLLKSGLWAWASQAPVRIGVGSREGSARLMTRVLAVPRDDPRIASEYRALARSLDADPVPWTLGLALDPEDRAPAARLAESTGGAGYVALCPFTTRPQKHWFEARWLELAKRLTARFGWTPVVLGGPGDREAGARLADACGGVNLAGETSLRQAAAVLEGAAAAVGVDTGLTHMAALLDAPTVALFGSTRPYLDTGRPRSVVLYKALPCSPCRRRPVCGGDFTCMRALLPAEVEAAVAACATQRLRLSAS